MILGNHSTQTSTTIFQGETFHSDQVSLSKFGLGTTVEFDHVQFTHIEETGYQFAVNMTLLGKSLAGSGATPLSDGSSAFVSNQNGSLKAGFVVYPSNNTIDLLVKE